MSRVHDALRKAAQEKPENTRAIPRGTVPTARVDLPVPTAPLPPSSVAVEGDGVGYADITADIDDLEEIIRNAQVVPYTPVKEALLVSLSNPREAPAEEFRTLRTRLNHLQTLQPLHTVVVTSPSPAEGKTFTAVNLAIAQAQLAERSVLMGDFDLRRPVVHNLFQIDRAPGLTDYLQGECEFSDALRRIDGLNLYVLPAGTAVKNPLEILNTRQAKLLFEELPRIFDWAIFDTPPLLFSADANLLATLADGTILVVKIGSTTFDNVTRAMQSLCENNVLGIVANGARASELYSKYTYYYSKAEAE